MTRHQLNAKAERQVRELQSWVRYCNSLIEAKIDDAKAHAVNAVTKVARRLPEGRVQINRVRSHPSTTAALTRLDELAEHLAGPSEKSLRGELRNAREQFYNTAFIYWLAILDPSLLKSTGPKPLDSDISYLRGLPLHGHDCRAVVAGRTDQAKRSLIAAIARTANHLSADAGKELINDAFLKAWQEQTKASLLSTVKTLLSDGQIAADRLAGRDLIDPQYLDNSVLEIA